MSSPTQRSLKYMRDNGWFCAIVERYNSFAHIRQDMFGCLDILCCKADVSGVTGIQTTSSPNRASRDEKADNPAMKAWLAAGNRYKLHIWVKRKRKRGGKAFIWRLREL